MMASQGEAPGRMVPGRTCIRGAHGNCATAHADWVGRGRDAPCSAWRAGLARHSSGLFGVRGGLVHGCRRYKKGAGKPHVALFSQPADRPARHNDLQV
jgi:hypothetical protein